MENIAQNIKKLRELKGLSPEQMADKLDVDPRTYRKFESGEKSPTIETLVKIAEILEMHLMALIGFSANQVFNNGQYQGNFSNNQFENLEKIMALHNQVIASKDEHISSLKDEIQALKDEIDLLKEFSKMNV